MPLQDLMLLLPQVATIAFEMLMLKFKCIRVLVRFVGVFVTPIKDYFCL